MPIQEHIKHELNMPKETQGCSTLNQLYTYMSGVYSNRMCQEISKTHVFIVKKREGKKREKSHAI